MPASAKNKSIAVLIVFDLKSNDIFSVLSLSIYSKFSMTILNTCIAFTNEKLYFFLNSQSNILHHL